MKTLNNYFNCFFIVLLFSLFGFIQKDFSQTISERTTTKIPTPDHILLIIFENHSYSEIIGSSSAPYINALATDSNAALFTNSYAIEHPSQPNYLDLFSGSNQGITDDNKPATFFTTPNLARQLFDASKTFISFSEDLPAIGSDVNTSAAYARKHNPLANWVGTGTNQVSDTVNQPFILFPSASSYSSLPTVSYIIPNLNHDMHDGTIAMGDTWMHTYLDSFRNWALTHNSLLIMTFDEDDYGTGNHIATIFYGPMVKGGNYSDSINHYCVLRTIEDMYSLPYAANSATAKTITSVWKSSLKINSISFSNASFQVFPNPANDYVNIISNKFQGPIIVSIVDAMGRRVGIFNMQGSNKLTINTAAYNSGTYNYSISSENYQLQSGKFIINAH